MARTNEPMTNDSDKIQQIMKILELPKHVISFTLHVQEGQLPRIECEFYPDDKRDANAIGPLGLTTRVERLVD